MRSRSKTSAARRSASRLRISDRRPRAGLLLIEDDHDRGIRRDLVRRVRNILAVLITAPEISGVQGPPGWRIHQLSGDRAGTWRISVSGNWRIDLKNEEIWNLDLEDDH